MPQRSTLTPLGDLTVSEEDGSIVAVDWGRGRDQADTPLLRAAVAQLQDYFDGRRASFDLPLAPHGTPFRQRVWALMREIPAGATRSYGEMAEALGSAARAVGGACGANPIPIIIPCHRVLAAGGRIGGYSGGEGAPSKLWLLDHERRAWPGDAGHALPAELPLGPGRTALQGTTPR